MIKNNNKERITAIANDADYKGADLVTETTVYNVAYSQQTVAGKLSSTKTGKNKKGEEKPYIELIAEAIADAHENSLEYKFLIGDDMDLSIQEKLDELNNLKIMKDKGLKITDKDIITHKFD